MEADSSRPGTPTGGPLQVATPERVNQLQQSHGRDSSVHDKISQFNSMSVGAVSKQLERKTADAALKRAMLGREEAEIDARRYRDEVVTLRRAVEEGKERERRVGERLETVMEHYGRAKETHAHTQALWEKEIRRARKETFKSQSSTVKNQEELKAARVAIKALEESLEREKERSRVREQEAFAARYQIVGVQEQLEQAQARIMVVEQERDVFKTAAKNEEVARIAAEGRLPLPKTVDADDEFASPPKKGIKKRKVSQQGAPRISLSTMEITSSMATELEIEELTLQVQWERQRADRAQEMVEFLQAECEMHCCQCSKSKSRASLGSPPQRRRQSTPIPPAAMIEELRDEEEEQVPVEQTREELEMEPEMEPETEPVVETLDANTPPTPEIEEPEPVPQPQQDAEAPTEVAVEVEHSEEFTLNAPRSKKEPRRSTIFCAQEGIFRTVSEQEAEALQAQEAEKEIEKEIETKRPVRYVLDEDSELESRQEHEQAEQAEEEEEDGEKEHTSVEDEAEHMLVDDEDINDEAERATEVGESEPPTPQANPRMYARTPSVEPPAFAMLGQGRTSLLSLLNAPHDQAHNASVPRIPTVPDDERHHFEVRADRYEAPSHHDDYDDGRSDRLYEEEKMEEEAEERRYHQDVKREPESELEQLDDEPEQEPYHPGSSTASYTVTTTVPLRDETAVRSSSSTSSLSEKLRTPSNASNASFDLTNPALTPTMTREQALAKIRERRGRAKSAAQQGGAASAQKKIVQGLSRRDMSAPTAKTGRVRS